MKRLRLFIEKDGESIIILLSITSFLIGLVYCVGLIFKDFFYNYQITDNQIKMIIILISGGLLGSVLDFVLKKYVNDLVTKYFDEGKIEKLVSKSVEDNILLEKEQNAKAVIDEQQNSKDLNTVIVPVALSFNMVLKNSLYQCPSDRTFKKGLNYIAFYKDKKIHGIGEIENGNPTIENDLLVFRFKNYKELDIPHEQKGAFVQNKLYCNSDKLISAKSTKEIR